MFPPEGRPHVFGIAPGEDFSQLFVRGLIERTAPLDPMDVARIRVLVNTHRTGRRMTQLLVAEGARLLPRILPVTELAQDPDWADPSPPAPALRRRLQLTRLVLALLDREPDLAPRASAFDLADSLAGLIDEMHEEGVSPEALIGQDFGELSDHWARSARVLSIVAPYFGPGSAAEASGAARLAELVARIAEDWTRAPPAEPVIVAGSTGSHGTTFRLMQAVAGLPQGALVLPGYDFGQHEAVWEGLVADRAEDHPQYRFARLRQALHLAGGEIRPWTGDARPSPRNALLSLALRPAPVSDQWIVEGPALGPLTDATEGIDLIEAPTLRAEALAIATAARAAVHRGEVAAVVTPDRDLTRLIAAELDRWGIAADDSAGEPLAQTAQGRLLRHAADALVAPLRIDQALVILKHPSVHAAEGRGRHLDWTRQLEMRLRREGQPYPSPQVLQALIRRDGADREDWAGWIATALFDTVLTGDHPLSTHLRRHIALVELLSGGPALASDAPPLPVWSGAAGSRALQVMAELEREADAAGTMSAAEYRDVLSAILSRAEVRAAAEAHTGVRFWGTIEARIQGADLVILAGLNEGVWPARPSPDPWMNRRMRKAVGLTLPERRIGLSAHDFQQAASAPRVILSRPLRDDSAETVPSRWLARLTNLLSGLEETGVPALEGMLSRGRGWLALSERIDRPGPTERIAPARRPAPRPPVTARPRRLSVTEIQTLIRDPYAIYARHVLGLKPLDPLRPEPDALVQGTVVHRVLQDFVTATLALPALLTREALLDTADAVLAARAHWPGIRHVWRGRIEAFADWFVAQEIERRLDATPLIAERKAEFAFPDPQFTLVGKPDRIDLRHDGTFEILDYKTGALPSAKDIQHFDRQLQLLAMMAEGGVFGGPPGRRVSRLAHVGLGSDPKFRALDLEPGETARTATELAALLRAYLDPAKGFPAQRLREGQRWEGDFDHLSRFGEWSTADPAIPEDVG